MFTTPDKVLGIPLAHRHRDTDISSFDILDSRYTKLFAHILTVSAGGGAQYTTITAALTASVSGDAVYIYPGTYTGNIVVPSGVSLIGADRSTVIIAAPTGTRGPTVTLNGNNTVGNLTIQSTTGWTYTLVGFGSSAAGATIDSVNILGSGWGDSVAHYLIDATNWTTGNFYVRNSLLTVAQAGTDANVTFYGIFAHTSATTGLIQLIRNTIILQQTGQSGSINYGIYADHPANSWNNGKGIYANTVSASGAVTNYSVYSSGGNLNSYDNILSGTTNGFSRAEEFLRGSLFSRYADTGNVGTGEDTLYTDTLSAGTLASNGDKVTVTYAGIFAGAVASTQELRVYFGGTKIYDSGALAIGAATSNWTVNVIVIRVSSTVVRATVFVSTDFATLFPYSTYTEITGLTLSNSQIIKITGEAAGAGAADNQIVAKLGTIAYVQAIA